MAINIGAAESISEPATSQKKLSGNMGSLSLAMTVLAFSAPLTTVAGYIPVSLMFGGVGSPLLFVFVSVMMLLFGIGYVTLNNAVKRSGDFYSFISYGLGKSAGLGAGLTAAVSYFVLLAGVTSYFGVSCAELQTSLTGSAFPWYAYALSCWAVVGILGYFHVELSAKVLLWVMLAEIVVCLGFSFGVLQVGGDTTLAAMTPFSPSELTKEGVNIPFSMLFVVSFFMGFEATALYRDELKDPDTTIPRATYGSILFIGAMYTICVYALIMAYGPSAQAVATDSPATMFSNAFGRFIDPRLQMIITVLVLSSAFASALSTHNVLARYLFNLGTDGALPKPLSRIHVKHGSPFASSMAVSTMVLLVLFPFIVIGAKPELLYGQLSGVGTSGVIILMTVVNLSSLTWYLRKGRYEGISFAKAFLAPAISSVFFIGLVGLVAYHFELLVGGEPGERTWLLYCLVGVLFAGMALAQYFKRNRPAVYERLGRSHP
ncbi:MULTISPECIES: APC family permease [unclassified Pseudomonas]|jgi:amino acid transporter|uniref:APC family permease n=1 Tax=unclassified Pseudomonas TaxID=196821 RepID=UPI001CBACF00|nr:MULTISPECIES: APC family permease [unclassified Pseudomonas]